MLCTGERLGECLKWKIGGLPASRLKPRRRPAQARSRDTVQAILEAAAQIFERHGYAAGTTNRIATRAGVSVGSLYQYFPNKDAILVALTDALIAQGALRATDGVVVVHEWDVSSDLDLDLDSVRAAAGRRPLALSCLDWTERRPHLAGALGAALLQSLLRRGCVRRRPDGCALRVTETGQEALAALGIKLPVASH